MSVKQWNAHSTKYILLIAVFLCLLSLIVWPVLCRKMTNHEQSCVVPTYYRTFYTMGWIWQQNRTVLLPIYLPKRLFLGNRHPQDWHVGQIRGLLQKTSIRTFSLNPTISPNESSFQSFPSWFCHLKQSCLESYRAPSDHIPAPTWLYD